MYYNEGKKTL